MKSSNRRRKSSPRKEEKVVTEEGHGPEEDVGTNRARYRKVRKMK
jgi:hypothetical protein